MFDTQTNTHADVLAKLLGLNTVPESKRAEILTKIGSLLMQAIVVRALEALSESQKDELDKLVERQGDDVLWDYLEKHVPDFAKLAEEEAEQIKGQIEVVMSAVRES